ELLINEGLFVEACTYLIKIRNNSNRILTLYDRLYNHCDYKLGNKFAKLQAPFNIMVVKPKMERKMDKGLGLKTNLQGKVTKDLFANESTPTSSKPNMFSNKVDNKQTVHK